LPGIPGEQHCTWLSYSLSKYCGEFGVSWIKYGFPPQVTGIDNDFLKMTPIIAQEVIARIGKWDSIRKASAQQRNKLLK
jgi:hypothetical protein